MSYNPPTFVCNSFAKGFLEDILTDIVHSFARAKCMRAQCGEKLERNIPIINFKKLLHITPPHYGSFCLLLSEFTSWKTPKNPYGYRIFNILVKLSHEIVLGHIIWPSITSFVL